MSQIVCASSSASVGLPSEPATWTTKGRAKRPSAPTEGVLDEGTAAQLGHLAATEDDAGGLLALGVGGPLEVTLLDDLLVGHHRLGPVHDSEPDAEQGDAHRHAEDEVEQVRAADAGDEDVGGVVDGEVRDDEREGARASRRRRASRPDARPACRRPRRRRRGGGRARGGRGSRRPPAGHRCRCGAPRRAAPGREDPTHRPRPWCLRRAECPRCSCGHRSCRLVLVSIRTNLWAGAVPDVTRPWSRARRRCRP